MTDLSRRLTVELHNRGALPTDRALDEVDVVNGACGSRRLVRLAAEGSHQGQPSSSLLALNPRFLGMQSLTRRPVSMC